MDLPLYRIVDSALAGRKGIWIKNFPDNVRSDLENLLTEATFAPITNMLFFAASDLDKLEAYLTALAEGKPAREPSAQLWAVIELFGHQIIAGCVSKVEPFGAPMVQVDVPATDSQPAFTKQFGPQAIYGITYVSEQVARSAANEARHKPVKVYVPEIDDLDRLISENKTLRRQLRQRQLGDLNGFDDDDHA